jgi:hypothetical protein
MPLRPAYLKSKLSRPLPIKGGGVLRTVAEARAYMIALPPLRETRLHWQRAAALMMAEVDVADLTHQLQLALFVDHALDLEAMDATT